MGRQDGVGRQYSIQPMIKAFPAQLNRPCSTPERVFVPHNIAPFRPLDIDHDSTLAAVVHREEDALAL